jgi:hypothetical protein
MRYSNLAAMLVLSVCLLAKAEEPAPATAPVVSADRQTPRGTLKVLAAAMARGDAEEVQRSLYAANPSEDKMRKAMADFSAAIARLRKALEASFGKAEAAQLTGDMEGVLDANNHRVDAATESVRGNDATVQISDPTRGGVQTVHMKKGETGWQIVLEDEGRRISPEVMETKSEELSVRANALVEVADDLASNKNKTIEQVQQAIQAKVIAAMHRKATQPTTQP